MPKTVRDEDRGSRRREEQLERTRREIMLCAARVVSRDGYLATNMRAIAKEAGFTASSLYTYFSRKEEIFEALGSELMDRVVETLEEPLPAGLVGEAKLAVLTHRLNRLSIEYREALVLVFSGATVLPGEDAPERLQRLGCVSTAFADWFERNTTAKERCGHSPATAARILQGLHRTFAEQALLEANGEIDGEVLEKTNALSLKFFWAALSAPTD